MNLETIRFLVKAKRYQIKLHALQHALKEGFSESHMVEAILTGQIIEQYPERHRVLICGRTTLDESTQIFLHVVCEHYYPNQVDFVTAYIPDEVTWGKPPFKRRQRRK